MRFQVVSNTGQGLALASHLSSEGHSVGLVLGTDSELGNGVVDKTSKQHPDVVIFDSDSFGKQADELRENGMRVLGASVWSKLLVEDTEYATSVVRSLGWPTSGVTNGINLYITGWFNGDKYISTYTSLVYRRFMSSGRGPDVNFTGVVSNFWVSRDGKVVSEILTPLSKVLKRTNHRGPFHVHLLVDGNKYKVCEVNASFNHPLSLLLFENSKLSASDILLKLFDESSKPVVPIEQWSGGVLLSVPPYPYPLGGMGEGATLDGVNQHNLKHLWLVDVKKQDGRWFGAGLSGKLGYVTARGSSVNETTRRIYRTISRLKIRDLQYRDDVGRNTYKLLSTLRGSGWIR